MSIRHYQSEQTHKILKGKIFDSNAYDEPSKKESDHIFQYDYVKEDLYGKVKDFINRYAIDGSKIEEESQKNK